MKKEVKQFNNSQSKNDAKICNMLANVIDDNLTCTENKIWHAHPVWLIDGNPIVGYSKLKDCVRLMFWSGQSFDEDGLEPEGSFKAAEIRYTDVAQVDEKSLKLWLKKAEKIQWDYKNIAKKKGQLERIS